LLVSGRTIGCGATECGSVSLQAQNSTLQTNICGGCGGWWFPASSRRKRLKMWWTCTRKHENPASAEWEKSPGFLSEKGQNQGKIGSICPEITEIRVDSIGLTKPWQRFHSEISRSTRFFKLQKIRSLLSLMNWSHVPWKSRRGRGSSSCFHCARREGNSLQSPAPPCGGANRIRSVGSRRKARERWGRRPMGRTPEKIQSYCVLPKAVQGCTPGGRVNLSGLLFGRHRLGFRSKMGPRRL
jgi:hypothetical protein